MPFHYPRKPGVIGLRGSNNCEIIHFHRWLPDSCFALLLSITTSSLKRYHIGNEQVKLYSPITKDRVIQPGHPVVYPVFMFLLVSE
jgi:hypothetical protein